MARKQRDIVNYFPHFANASEGDTLTILQSRFGNDGYALWFKLLEKLANSDGHIIDCRNPVKWQLLQAKSRLSEDKLSEIMTTLSELKAIDTDLWEKHHVIWCQNLVDNVSNVYENRRRESPQKPIIEGSNISAAVISTDRNISAAVIYTSKSTQRRVKKSIVENRKEDDPLPPTATPPVVEDSSSSSLSEQPVVNLHDLYKKEIGELTPTMIETLDAAQENYSTTWITEAIQVAVKSNKRSWVYIKGVLEKCKAEGHSPFNGNGRDPHKSDDPNKYIKGKYSHVVKR